MATAGRPVGAVTLTVARTDERRLRGRLVSLAPRRPPRRWTDAASADILARHRHLVPEPGRRLVAARAQVTSTGMVVIMLAERGHAPCVVLKLPLGTGAARALARETVALEALHAEDRLGSWRRLVPRPLAAGSLDGQPYRLDGVLPGRPMRDSPTSGALRDAAHAIGDLQGLTSAELPSVAERCLRWVDLPLQELEQRSGPRGPARLAARRLRRELHAALADWPGAAGVAHGDFWLGNILFDGSPTGVVDWESWGACELPLHDLLHLLLYTRRSRSRMELGEIVARQLSDGGWSGLERELLSGHEAWCDGDTGLQRPALLLYWLRHAAVHARQQPQRVGYRYRLWEQRNLLPVVAAL